MIPWAVARELRTTVLDYLRSTWALGDPELERALFGFLTGPSGIFQGPYVKLALPFRAAPKPAEGWPLEVRPPYTPHAHQLAAWQRLSTQGGHVPKPTLVTTGTGSGKTECFLYPILDHALRKRGEGQRGIKAIVLYPMNALAFDQAARFAEAIAQDARMRGKLRVGLFVGGEGNHGQMGPSHVIDDHDRLLQAPPDILLTNYRMLDLLLQRPKDAPLWKDNAPGTLRYLVLDELHTYDGAQGTDVACLLRRLAHRLGSAESICPVGTSATVGSGTAASQQALLAFAATLFDQPFGPDAFIGESRVDASELLTGVPAAQEQYPEVLGPLPAPGEDVESHLRAVVTAWQGPAEALRDRVALGRWVRSLPLVRALLSAASATPQTLAGLDAAMSSVLPRFAEASRERRSAWIGAALSALSYAQRTEGDFALPLCHVQVTLWVREVRRLLGRVGAVRTPSDLRFLDDAPLAPDAQEVWAPMYHCRACGHAGWLATETGPASEPTFGYAQVARAQSEGAPTLRLLHVDAQLAAQATDAPRYFDVAARRWAERMPAEGPEVFVLDANAKRCPACAANELGILAARSTTLSSVAVGHLYTTPLNTDRKLLAFSDSVQDATHRAGFFGARTFRFAMRAAILAGVPQEGAISLAELPEAMWQHWVGRLGGPTHSPIAELAALLLPDDLQWLDSAEEWQSALDEHRRANLARREAGEAESTRVPDPPAQLVTDLRARLRWECVRELGVASRVGRTLEQTSSLAVGFDAAAVDRAARDGLLRLRERVGGPFRDEHTGALRALTWFMVGLLTRLRTQGGIFDPLLQPYLQSGGRRFLLSKQQQPVLSTFGRTGDPRFLSDVATQDFESLGVLRPGAWALDWLSRVFGLERDASLAASTYLTLLPALEKAGLLARYSADVRGLTPGAKAQVFALRPDALHVGRRATWFACSACRREVSALDDSLAGAPCLRIRCEGRLMQRPADASHEGASDADETALPSAHYYRHFYQRPVLGRVFAREHTGLLERGVREALEVDFKVRARPDAPNLLSCTPTLEMGVDIGDLSATLLCSVPPATASYVQRVGRAGRRTGNALVLVFAATKPHDLFFFQAPLDAMAGPVSPPGCYLSAPEVLKRQALAFVFDSYARTGAKLGGRLGDVLVKSAKRPGDAFPDALVEFASREQRRLQDGFLQMFGHEAGDAARVAVLATFALDARGRVALAERLEQTVDEARTLRDSLRERRKRIDDRLAALGLAVSTDAANGGVAATAGSEADLKTERSDLLDDKSFTNHQLAELQERDIWQWMADASLLPNYAFPERGVVLEARVRGSRAGQGDQAFEWTRAPSSALTELAPFNTFYASGCQVTIDGVELKGEEPFATWRLCPTCNYGEVVDTSKHAANAADADRGHERCPRCQDENWGDTGQQRNILRMGRAFSLTNRSDAAVGDDGDDRKREHYEKVVLLEAGHAVDAFGSDADGFGFEFQPRLTLRELNVGQKPKGQRLTQSTFAGQTVADVAFTVCRKCGKAQDVSGRDQHGPPRSPHRAWCPLRKRESDPDARRSFHLMRELRSEGLRVVLPYVDGLAVEEDIANARALFALALRELYGGDPDFLRMITYDDPLPGRDGRRRMLVVMDQVPGGTALLQELAKSRGKKLAEGLARARNVLVNCACQHRTPAVRACYQCLYAFRHQQDLPLLQRERALAIADLLLPLFARVTPVETVGLMTQSEVLESELEARFVQALRDDVTRKGGRFTQNAKDRWELTLGSETWQLRAQVELDRNLVEIPSRADFVLDAVTPVDPKRRGRPRIAVFLDGLQYHVCPAAERSRLARDASQRQAIAKAGMLSWSITWKDLVAPLSPQVSNWLPDAGASFLKLQSLVHRIDQTRKLPLSPMLATFDKSPFEALMALLQAPTDLALLAKASLSEILSRGGRAHAVEASEWHRAAYSMRAPPTPQKHDGTQWVALRDLANSPHARLLASADPKALQAGPSRDDSLQVTVQLDANWEARAEPAFETSWRLWLRAWNFLQMLPQASLVAVGDRPIDESSLTHATTSSADDLARERKDVSPPQDERFAVLAEIDDEKTKRLVHALLSTYEQLEPPTVPFEPRHLIPDADDLPLAFVARKVAFCTSTTDPLAVRLTALGWQLFGLDDDLNQEEIERALRLRGASHG